MSNSTKEMMQPCLVHPHLISLVPRTCTISCATEEAWPVARAKVEIV